MILLLVAKEGVPVDAKLDASQIQKAVTAYNKNLKRHREPFILTIQGYDVYAIPETIRKVESEGDNIVKLDLTAIMRLAEEEELDHLELT